MLVETIVDDFCNHREHDFDDVVELVCIQVGLDCEIECGLGNKMIYDEGLILQGGQ